mgnify:CR=1 FL=1
MEQTPELTKALSELKRLTGLTMQITADTPEETATALEQIRCLCTAYREKYNKNDFLLSLMKNGIPAYDIYERAGRLHIPVEEKELTEAEKKILEVNAGVYCFEISELVKIIGTLKQNSMGLYYLTDVIKMFVVSGKKIGGVLVEDNTEILSLNTKLQLEMLTRILRIKINTMHMNNGVTIEDINTTYIYEDVEIGMDTVIHPNTTIKSGVVIGEDCNIGPNAYIREGCKLADKVKVGSFVEIKKAIEKAFDVKVEKVNTLNTKSKKKRVGRYTGKTKTYKKAIVTLASGQSIEF